MIKIEKETFFFLKISFLNLFIGIMSYFMAIIGTNMRIINLYILTVWNIIFFFMILKNNKDRFQALVISIWQYTLLLDVIYRLERYKNTPYEILYILDMVGILLLLLMSRNKRIRRTDPVVILVEVIILYCIISTIINQSNIIDCLGAIRLLIRFFVLYLYYQCNPFTIPKWLNLFFYISVIAFIVECYLGVNQDFRNGLFGYTYTTDMFPLVIVAWASYSVYKCVHFGKGIVELGIKLAGIEICFLLMEAKAEMIIFALYVILLFLIQRYRKYMNALVQKGVFMILICVIAVVGWKYVGVIFEKWEGWGGSEDIVGTVIQGMNSRFLDNMAWRTIYAAEAPSLFQKIFGIGGGVSIPPRGFIWLRKYTLDVSEVFNIIKFSEIFENYHYSLPGIRSIILDLGWVGLVLFIMLDIILIYRCCIIMRRQQSMLSMVLGIVGLWQTIIITYRFMVSDILTEPLWAAVSMVLFGAVTYQFYSERGQQR